MEKQIENVDSKKDILDSSILPNETKDKGDVIENYVALINIKRYLQTGDELFRFHRIF